MKVLLSGNEAIARGAFEGGVLVACGYPGTPSSEILETVAKEYRGAIYAEWSVNEKVAMDAAAGASYSGVRSMVTTKLVGMNVLSDSLFYLPYTGLEAGLVVVVCDDTGMFSSQNEQDNRWYAILGKLPMLEPSDSQECKDMVVEALKLSEKFDTPFVIRSEMRIAHSKSEVFLGEREKDIPLPKNFPRDIQKYNCNALFARKKREVILKRFQALKEFAETSSFNKMILQDKQIGIISSGIVYEYAREVFPNASFLKLGMIHPLPEGLIRDFASQCKTLIVIEQLDPFLETQIKALGVEVKGKEIFPPYDEILPEKMRECGENAGILKPSPRRKVIDLGSLPTRAAVFCPGCPHRATFYALAKLKVPVMGDIGCYNLGSLPPFNSQHTMGSMGASIGQLHGVSISGCPERAVATIGDSTFFHAGMPPLVNMVHNKSKGVVIIMDNSTTAMTGHQDHPGMDKTLMGEPTERVDIHQLVESMKVKLVKSVNAFNVKEVEQALKECLLWEDGPAVMITRGECIFVSRKPKPAYSVDLEKCVACETCLKVGCPAVVKSEELNLKNKRKKARIDPVLCNGCGVCSQVCPTGAIFQTEELEAKE